MTPEQKRIEHDEFTQVKMTVFRQMFPVAAAIARGERVLTQDAATIVNDPAMHNARFQDAVEQAWQRYKANRAMQGWTESGSASIVVENIRNGKFN
jgi:hypothetical protein